MAVLNHPYGGLSGGRWLRGNLHAHTTRSDGAREPQAVVDDYAARGYDFLMLSDHDVYTSELMLAELAARGMVLIPGNEVTAGGPHMLHVYADRRVEPVAQRQRVLMEAGHGRGFVVACHPNWEKHFEHCPLDWLMQWDGYAGLEIYNGLIGRHPGSPYASDKWDQLLSAGRRLWGFANDDSHAAQGDTGLGWNMVYSAERTAKGIADALAAGRFYASTGVVITDIQVDRQRICIRTENAQRIVAHKRFGQRLAVVDAGAMEVEVPEDAAYVRFECWGAGEQFAWTQPFFVVQ